VPEVGPDVVERAIGYPYPRPSGAFRYWPASDRTERVEAIGEDDLRGRTIVLAIGSNAAPEQLRRKFGSHPTADRPVLVVPTRLQDHDVVYAALVARYGSVPATLIERAGTTCHIHVTMLDADQLERMHETEGVGSAYELVSVDARLVEIESLGRPTRCEAYVAKAGPLLHERSPVALTAIAADGRSLRAWDQATVLATVASSVGLSTEAFIGRVTTDEVFRRAAGERLTGL
jgi:hypothetical protein